MRMEIHELGIKIVPENAQDIAYIDHVLGMADNHVRLVQRTNILSTSELAYIEITAQQRQKESPLTPTGEAMLKLKMQIVDLEREAGMLPGSFL